MDVALTQPLTSREIQREHAGVYERLLGACRTVVSVPLALPLTGDRRYTERHGSILVHLPRRAWVGIEGTNGAPSPGALLEYRTDPGEFTAFPATLRERYERLTASFDAQAHRRFHVVLEAQDGNSSTVAASLTAATTLAHCLDEGILSAADAQSWLGRPAADVLDDRSFRTVVELGRSRQAALRPGRNVHGSGIVTALVPGATQCLAFDDARVVSLAPSSLGGRDSEPSEWPVDLIVLGSGTRNELGLTPTLFAPDEELDRYLTELRGVFPSTFPLVRPLAADATSTIGALQDRLWLDLHRQWTLLWRQSRGDHPAPRLIDAIQRRTAFSFATERIHPALRAIVAAVRAAFGEERAGVMALGTWEHGGACMIVTPASEQRRSLPVLLQCLRDSGIDDATVEYLSWRDGSAHDGARVEQHLASGRVSALLPEQPLRVQRVTAAGVTQRIVHRTAHAVDADVLVEMLSEKIFVAGKPVSAKELPSQRMCADILRLLAGSKDRTIRSTELPRSSYRASRGELGSKVLHPLSATVLARTGKRLTFTTAGSITEYSVHLDLGSCVIEVLSPFVATPPTAHAARSR